MPKIKMWDFFQRVKKRGTRVSGVRVVPFYNNGQPYPGRYLLVGFEEGREGPMVSGVEGDVNHWSLGILRNWFLVKVTHTFSKGSLRIEIHMKDG